MRARSTLNWSQSKIFLVICKIATNDTQHSVLNVHSAFCRN